MIKVIVTTFPFNYGEKFFKNTNFGYHIQIKYNEIKRKYTREEHIEVIKKEQPDVIIAGTEKYDKEILSMMPNLKMISRVGIGIDGIDLSECAKRGIIIKNTPDAPTNAVAELTVCQILNMLRKIQNVSNDMIYKERWNRYIGRELKNCSVGIIGFGRVGKSVYKKLKNFNCKIYYNDIKDDKSTDIDHIFKNCDIITLHIPLEDKEICNINFITKRELNMMKENVRLLNMSRGGIINEDHLYDFLLKNKKSTIAIDTFENEPYKGKLTELGNVYLTPHLGSCTIASRIAMEEQAIENFLMEEF